jgi:hydroxymethylbilane synthase
VIRIGTRGSALALAQANWVAAMLANAELVTIPTSGDRGENISDKSRWTSELERALLEGEIDIAVHSAKDVPGELAEGTEIAFVPDREDPRDVICGAASLGDLRSGARVGTSSLRRAAQVRALRDDLEIVELRGNVDTRLRKLSHGDADAIIVAAAGLKRLGREDAIGGYLDDLLPAPGQGALIVQGRTGVGTLLELRHLRNSAATMAVTAERAFAHALGASCNTPIGAFADGGDGVLPKRGTHVRLRGWVGLPDGSHWISDEFVGNPGEAGRHMAERMLAVGARELLDKAEVWA